MPQARRVKSTARAVGRRTKECMAEFDMRDSPLLLLLTISRLMDQFTVVLRGESFTLYRDQIDFDAPNYFTALFTSDFVEAQSRRVELSRSPELFRLIVNYLSGYEILPLDVPPSLGMSQEAALRSLLVDAVFYGLDNLAARLRAKELQSPLQRVRPELELLGLAPIKVDLDDLVAGRLSPRVVIDERGLLLERDGSSLSPILVVAHDIPVMLVAAFGSC